MTYQQYASGNGSGDRSADDIQRDLGKIRGEIDHTLDALSAQLQPGQLLHQAWQSLRGGGGGKMLNNLSTTVQENPLPLAMIAAGFGYLIYSDSKRRQQPPAAAALPQQDDFDFEPIGIYSDGEAEGLDADFGGGVKEGAKEKLRGLADSAGQATQKAKHMLGQKAESGRQRMQQSRQWAGDKVHRAEDQARAAKDWGSNLIQEQPLVLAGLGLAVGAALAALVPVSRKEHEMLGSTGESLRSKAGSAAQEATHKAQHLAEKAKGVGTAALEAGKEKLANHAGDNDATQPGVLGADLGSAAHDHTGNGSQGIAAGGEVASHSFESPGASERPGATYAPTDPVSPGVLHAAAETGGGLGSHETAHRETSVTSSYPTHIPGSSERGR